MRKLSNVAHSNQVWEYPCFLDVIIFYLTVADFAGNNICSFIGSIFDFSIKICNCIGILGLRSKWSV